MLDNQSYKITFGPEYCAFKRSCPLFGDLKIDSGETVLSSFSKGQEVNPITAISREIISRDMKDRSEG